MSIIRSSGPDAIKFSRAKGWNARFDGAQTKSVEEYAEPRVFARAWEFLNGFAVSRFGRSACTGIEDRSFILPWGRTFEGEIDFKLICTKMEIPKFKTKTGARKK